MTLIISRASTRIGIGLPEYGSTNIAFDKSLHSVCPLRIRWGKLAAGFKCGSQTFCHCIIFSRAKWMESKGGFSTFSDAFSFLLCHKHHKIVENSTCSGGDND
ncbi:hypothetical protein JHK85_014645 [Glycine max]|uniref:Uncharacterized protein n=1 Tax=Glycine max TaxID=3847 RepID=I1K7V6_SOYBN|nr:hypothetical protein JHK85_014645 [Glycine max]